ncbi:Uu.00g000440.m01.CDS01 [Anthostomella pinea]|uniref:Uu.00g000440.m01.CDS01 n=1 Tax=Anthostomella pinea TaxID=933095 RepID=A0AAI8VJ59_9PEZI|nr:Uu.00g000440.m01.CDS01 [Anthostomella pinea]
MTTAPPSPKRRHILSSINPESWSASPKPETDGMKSEGPPEEPLDAEPKTTAEATEKKTSKFRFKSKHSRSHRSSRHRDRDYEQDAERDKGRDGDPEPSSSHRHHRHRHHHHRHKRRRTRSRSPTPPNPYDPPLLDSDAAFRESLFDAMADDEGAAYWEGVYGQPIHVYSQARPSASSNNNNHNPESGGDKDGLAHMDDDEYAAYVRQNMWEKTHQGLLEERARREEKKRQRAEKESEAARLTREMERSLRRGEERRRKRSWKGRWEAYLQAWTVWDGALEGMAWPVESGRREDVGSAAVRDFFVMGIDPVDVGEAELLARLKEERVRWHPDKIQQRLGGKVDEAVMRDVTAVFQIVDKLWSDTRSKAH